MLPGPIFIIECPDCGSNFKKSSLASGNTFDAVVWSDGKIDAPMFVEYPELAKCKKCGGFYWVEDAAVVERVDWFSNENGQKLLETRYKHLDFIEFPTISQYFQALGSVKKNHAYIRIQIWRLYNNKFRRKGFNFLATPEQVKYDDNAAELISLLDENIEEGKFLKAELYRNIGLFNESRRLVERISDKYSHIKKALLNEIAQNNKYTIILPEFGEQPGDIFTGDFKDETILMDCPVAGTYYQNLTGVYPKLSVDDILTLKREPDNEFDALAIAVHDRSGVKLGYIPREQNEVIARLIDSGKSLTAKLISKENENNFISLNISIYLK